MLWNKWFRTTFFSNFLIFSTQADNDNGHEGGGVAEDAGRKEVGAVGDIGIKIKINHFLHAFNPFSIKFDVHVELCYLFS